MIEIKHKDTGKVLIQFNADTLKNANLRDVDLSDADLSSANLSDADLYIADLRGANLRGANLHSTKMFGVDLTQADLADANLILSNLIQAELTGANLARANLVDADLSGADLSGATLFRTQFSQCLTLGQAKGLSLIKHIGPSSLDRATLQSCIEDLPEIFLLGVGYTEEEITAIRDLYGKAKPFQFYSCFISYSHKDEEFAKRLHARMREVGLRVWYAPEDIQGGKKLHEQINQAIQVHDRLLLILSDNSLNSEWVHTEIRRARKAEREQSRRKLFPIRLLPFDPAIKEWECFDADSGKDLGVELREYFIPDFENWKDHDIFEAGFARLLQDLKAEERTA